MCFFSNKKTDYNIQIDGEMESLHQLLIKENFKLIDTTFLLDIYMIHQNEDFSKIKRIIDMKNYAIIRDFMGQRSVIFKDDSTMSAPISSIFLTHEVLYRLGYFELFHLNEDIETYQKSFQIDNKTVKLTFQILDVKNQGRFLQIKQVNAKEIKMLIHELQMIGIKINLKKCHIDNIQNEFDKVRFKKF